MTFVIVAVIASLAIVALFGVFRWLHSFGMPWWLRAALVWLQGSVVGAAIATALFVLLRFTFLRDSMYLPFICIALYLVITFGGGPLVNYLRNLRADTNDQDHNGS